MITFLLMLGCGEAVSSSQSSPAQSPVVETFSAECLEQGQILAWDIHPDAIYMVRGVPPSASGDDPEGWQIENSYSHFRAILSGPEDLEPGYVRLEVTCDGAFGVRVHVLSPG